MFYKGGKMVAASPNTDLHGYGEEIRKELGSRIPRDKKLKVLDVGTGFGINVAFLARWLSKAKRDLDGRPLEGGPDGREGGAREESARRVRFVEASADDLDFGDGYL